MRLPLKTFWLFSRNIERIMAQKDMRALTVEACSQSGEAAQELRQQLVLEIGTITRVEEKGERDEEGFNELKALAQQMTRG